MHWFFYGALAFVAFSVFLALRRGGGSATAALAPAPTIIDHPSPNQSDRGGQSPTHLILHYTAMNSAQEALDRLSDPAAQVSSHYLVGADGTVWRLVGEDKSAWHAGVSFWRGKRNLNPSTIGIEIDNPGDRPFAEPQMVAVTALCRWILGQHAIPAQNVIGHADIAPGRKPDPGWFFDWKRLAANGIGVVPTPVAADYARSKDWKAADVRRALSDYGYSPDVDVKVAWDAFQRHFRPEVKDAPGDFDGESLARLAWLVRNKR